MISLFRGGSTSCNKQLAAVVCATSSRIATRTYTSRSSIASILSSPIQEAFGFGFGQNNETTKQGRRIMYSSTANATTNLPLRQSVGLQQRQNARAAFSTKTGDDDDDNKPEIQGGEEEIIIYESPMGKLISRLKVVSITSCLLSIVGLPTLIYLKNGDWPNMKQVGMGSIAFLGATGSTLALHFVFGPYILDLSKILDENGDQKLLKATTRSVFGWKNVHIFDPTAPDSIQPFEGIRPFANFTINDGQTPLYVHPELLEESTRLMMLGGLGKAKANEIDMKEDSGDDDNILAKKRKEKEDKKKQEQQQKQDDKDDDFF